MKPIEQVGEERRAEWIRAERAEAQRDRLYAQNERLKEALRGLISDLQRRADRSYCSSLDCFRRTECLGWEAKVRSGKFGESEMKAHEDGNTLMGKHRAFHEAAEMARALLSELEAEK